MAEDQPAEHEGEEEQQEALRRAKGKAPLTEDVQAEGGEEGDEDEDEADYEEEDDSEEEEEESDEESAEEEEEEQEGAGEENGAPAAKKQRTEGEAGSSKRAAPKDEEEEAAQILEGCSGDEVDPGLIIAGGRRARKGRPDAGASRPKYTAQVQLDSDEDDW